jgi:hypothetical protein
MARVCPWQILEQEMRKYVQFASTISGQVQARTVATVTLPPNSAKLTEFTNLAGDGNLQNSFIVHADTGPGVVLSKFVSFSEGALREVEVIGKDQAQLENTGDHPWSVEDGVTSTLVLFNHATDMQTFHVKVGGDKMAWLKNYKLAPMETRTISINDLISTGEKDDKGKSLPNNMRRGEVVWLTPGTSEVSGRVLQSDKLLAMARNFSCGTCGFLCHDLGLGPFSSINSILDGQAPLGDISPQYCNMPCTVYSSCPAYSNPTMPGSASYSWSGGGSVASLVSGGSSSRSTWKATAFGSATGNYSISMGSSAPYQCTGSGPITVPTPHQVEPIFTASQGPAACSTGQAGWARNVTNQVQTATGSAYAVSGLAMADTLTVGSKNDLGISGTRTGSDTTTGDGSFPDTYSVCSTLCPASSGESDALQSWTANTVGVPHVNGVIYKCGSITIDGR